MRRVLATASDRVVSRETRAVTSLSFVPSGAQEQKKAAIMLSRGLGVLVLVGAVLGQEDGSVCPPIDTGGDPVPSLCQGDTMNAGEAGAEYSVCRPSSVRR